MKFFLMKKMGICVLSILLAFSALFLCSCDDGEAGEVVDTQAILQQKTTEYYGYVTQSKGYLDVVAEDVYEYWYDAIYNDMYENDIDVAIDCALGDNSAYLTKIEENDGVIQELYREIRDCELSVEIRAVQSAYLDYYEFAVNVSGSFQTYSAQIDGYQNALKDALKQLNLEL